MITTNNHIKLNIMEELDKIVAEINNKTAEFQNNAALHLNGNKAAGLRARKASLALDKLFKEYRKLSIK